MQADTIIKNIFDSGPHSPVNIQSVDEEEELSSDTKVTFSDHGDFIRNCYCSRFVVNRILVQTFVDQHC